MDSNGTGHDHGGPPDDRHGEATSLTVYDRKGKAIAVDDYLYIVDRSNSEWRVVEITPELNPQAPPGTLRVTLSSSFIVHLPAGARIPDVYKVQDARETEANRQQIRQSLDAHQEAPAPGPRLVE